MRANYIIKLIILATASIFITVPSFASDPVTIAPEKIYTMAMVGQKPSFPGGDEAMYSWLKENMVFPEQAKLDSVQGRVLMQFDITDTGQIVNVRVARGRHEALDNEAKRLVESMPLWEPGRNNGEPVWVTYTLPVTFKLNN